MYEQIKFRLTGMSPMLCHNGAGGDPLNPHAKAIKEFTKKRVKTDSDHAAIAKIEWMMGLYLDDERRPCIPGENIEAMLTQSAKASRLGSKFQAGVISDGSWPILHEGPKDLESLYENANFRDRRGAKLNKKATVIRTRPRFMKWKIEPVVSFVPQMVNKQDVISAMENAGMFVGLGDYRPKFGRFVVEVL